MVIEHFLPVERDVFCSSAECFSFKQKVRYYGEEERKWYEHKVIIFFVFRFEKIQTPLALVLLSGFSPWLTSKLCACRCDLHWFYQRKQNWVSCIDILAYAEEIGEGFKDNFSYTSAVLVFVNFNSGGKFFIRNQAK